MLVRQQPRFYFANRGENWMCGLLVWGGGRPADSPRAGKAETSPSFYIYALISAPLRSTILNSDGWQKGSKMTWKPDAFHKSRVPWEELFWFHSFIFPLEQLHQDSGVWERLGNPEEWTHHIHCAKRREKMGSEMTQGTIKCRYVQFAIPQCRM